MGLCLLELNCLKQGRTIFGRNLGMDKVLVVFSEYKCNIFYMAQYLLATEIQKFNG